MCGIAGYLNIDSPDTVDLKAKLEQASARMALRGPDENGLYYCKRAGLAHRRLAIIDLTGGQQPMCDPETKATIAFNGEIYNFKRLRQQLETCGHTFQTDSDTEVLLHAWLEWGERCLMRLDGMFAFAIHDPRDDSLFLARDRLGVKPLFWSFNGKTLLFASSVSALLPLLRQTPQLNTDAVSHYLSTIRINLNEQTILDGVKLLEPGHWMRLAPSTPLTIQAYWTPTCPPSIEKDSHTTDASVVNLKQLLDKSVSDRLISDVPLGGFLSGGLDSTIIAALASRQSNHSYHAYNVGYQAPGFNEYEFVHQAANTYRMRCQQIPLDPNDYPSDWEWLIRQNGLPLTTPNEVPIYRLAKALKHEYTVALSGEGADEIFGGYTIAQFAGYDFDRASRTPVKQPSLMDQAIYRAYGQYHLPDLATQHILLNSWLTRQEKQLWLSPEHHGTASEAAILNAYREIYSRYPQASTLDQVMLAHLRINLEGLLLRVDSSTMAASVEARVPFTDHRLVDFAFGLPDDARITWSSPTARAIGKTRNIMEICQQNLLQSKCLLRRAYAPEVPVSILNRPKMSFPVPVFSWMQDWMAPMIRDILASSPLRKELFNPETVDHWLSGKFTMHPMKLWPIINLCLWHQTLQ